MTQNLCGLKSDWRLEELFDSFRRRRLFAACLQETWRCGSEDLVNGDCKLIMTGLSRAEQSRRGSQGVGILRRNSVCIRCAALPTAWAD